jgi:hypothetical protein
MKSGFEFERLPLKLNVTVTLTLVDVEIEELRYNSGEIAWRHSSDIRNVLAGGEELMNNIKVNAYPLILLIMVLIMVLCAMTINIH